MKTTSERRPVRAAVALAGAGSLGTFLAGALREIVLAIRAHNAAIADPEASPSDARILHPQWGKITIDAVGGSSAGALCSGQLVKALFEPEYLGQNKDLDTIGTMTGDWIEFGSFEHLSIEGNSPTKEGSVESPGWTFLSPNKLYDVAKNALNSDSYEASSDDPKISPLPDNQIVGVGITLTDLLGYHEFAEFDAAQVLGHQQFGADHAQEVRFHSLKGRDVRDLGVRQHSEIRRLFVGPDDASKTTLRRFLSHTRRYGKATAHTWKEVPERLGALAAASAALPMALGPMALTDPIEHPTEGGEDTIRRLYLDGGVLNNKPISPALTMARWQDEVRLLSHTDEGAPAYDKDTVRRLFDYERVCFFIDAFPDRTRGAWRSPHPDNALTGTPVRQMLPENVKARNDRIDEALDVPSKGMGMFLESLLTSLRAQDIRGVANTNLKVAKRAEFIRKLAGKLHHGSSTFALDTMDRAHAYAAVMEATADLNIDDAERNELTDVIFQADSFARMRGRRSVTIIPVFAPENLVEVLAGESLFAVGGLLSKAARLHDARTGQRIAQEVLKCLDPGCESQRVELPGPSAEERPSDSEPLVRRLQVFVNALIKGDGTGSPMMRGLVSFPFNFNPLVKLLRDRLDRTIQGEPRDDGGGR